MMLTAPPQHIPRQIITSHNNADYDAVASMVAAKKLYPEATLVSPTFITRQEFHDFTTAIPARFNFVQPKECDFSQVELVVVVDTRSPERLEHISDALAKPDITLHVYDHHPDRPGDIQADFSIIRLYGSCTAIFAEIIQEKGIELSMDEATMLGLGLYEDTGSFCFPNTTSHDFLAGAFLASQGMSFSIVKHLMAGDLTRQQVHVLDKLLKSAITHNIAGIPITIVEIALDNFLGDFASILGKLIEMEKLKVVFAIASMGDRIHMIARSSVKEVSVSKICQAFGGGGHPEAAAASIKESTPAQTRGQLLTLLVTTLSAEITVESHMTSPATVLPADTAIATAEKIMNRYGLKAVPIIDRTTMHCVGILELQTASRASTHQLGTLKVAEYMQRSFETLPVDAHLHVAIDLILQKRQRLIPIVRDDAVVGVLTRTDVLRMLVDESISIPEGNPHTKEHIERSVLEYMNDLLPKNILALLRSAGELGDDLDMPVFAVGGFVRDLLMKQPNLDIDLCIEGDVLVYANALAATIDGTVRHHHKFKTAVVSYINKEGQRDHIDVATARMEYYESPAALPSVELASIKMDLYRRDFSINALAIMLGRQKFGTLIDPFGGQKDIREKTISVLHSLSLVEDPTRILRAVRFERRFGFRISQQTERLIKNSMSLNMIERLSGSRLFNELKHVFDERNVSDCILRLDGWNFWKRIDHKLMLTPTKEGLLNSLDEVLGWYRLLYKDQPPENWMMYLMVMFQNIKHTEASDILDSLGLIERQKNDFTRLRGLAHKSSTRLIALHKNDTVTLGSMYESLAPLPLEGLLFLMARYGQEHNIGKDISLFMTKLKEVKPDLTGDDLMAIGYPQGPLLGHILRLLLLAKLDAKAIGKIAQHNLALAYCQANPNMQPDMKPTLEEFLAPVAPQVVESYD